jgi:hypothetical protein
LQRIGSFLHLPLFRLQGGFPLGQVLGAAMQLILQSLSSAVAVDHMGFALAQRLPCGQQLAAEGVELLPAKSLLLSYRCLVPLFFVHGGLAFFQFALDSFEGFLQSAELSERRFQLSAALLQLSPIFGPPVALAAELGLVGVQLPAGVAQHRLHFLLLQSLLRQLLLAFEKILLKPFDAGPERGQEGLLRFQGTVALGPACRLGLDLAALALQGRLPVAQLNLGVRHSLRLLLHSLRCLL